MQQSVSQQCMHDSVFILIRKLKPKQTSSFDGMGGKEGRERIVGSKGAYS